MIFLFGESIQAELMNRKVRNCYSWADKINKGDVGIYLCTYAFLHCRNFMNIYVVTCKVSDFNFENFSRVQQSNANFAHGRN